MAFFHVNNTNWNEKNMLLMLLINAYLRRKTFNENGNQKIEENIIAEGHQRYEVECSPVRGFLHTVEEDNVPIFLREDLYKKKRGKDSCYIYNDVYIYIYLTRHMIGKTFSFSKRAEYVL